MKHGDIVVILWGYANGSFFKMGTCWGCAGDMMGIFWDL